MISKKLRGGGPTIIIKYPTLSKINLIPPFPRSIGYYVSTLERLLGSGDEIECIHTLLTLEQPYIEGILPLRGIRTPYLSSTKRRCARGVNTKRVSFDERPETLTGKTTVDGF